MYLLMKLEMEISYIPLKYLLIFGIFHCEINGITRMDGLDQIIQWGAGSICGHSVVLLEFDGEMYAIESQDAWYWPKHNI